MSYRKSHRAAIGALKDALEAAKVDLYYRALGGLPLQLQGDYLTDLMGQVERYLALCDNPHRSAGRPKMTRITLASKYPGVFKRLHTEKPAGLAEAYGVSRASVYLWRKQFPARGEE
jgi:hypothetical protein